MPTLRPRSFFPLALIVLAGCDEGPAHRTVSPSTSTAAAPAPAPAPKPEPIKTRETLGKTTQEIGDADAELKKGGVVYKGQITEKGYLAVQGNAYVSIVGRAGVMQVQHAIELYNAETGDYPKTKDEFMEKIIKANNINLPQLPYYQEYAYDEKKHELFVIEYPAKKAQRERERDAK